MKPSSPLLGGSRAPSNSESVNRLAVELAEAADEVFTDVVVERSRPNFVPAFSDDEWDLSVLEPGRAASSIAIVRFGSLPSQFVRPAKRVAWAWINLDTPIERLTRKTAARSRLSPLSIRALLSQDVAPFLHHLAARGVNRLTAVSGKDFESFLSWIDARGWGRSRRGRVLFSITRMWLSGVHLPPDDRLPMPSWENYGIEDVLGPSNWAPGNRTIPIHPETMGSLLVWALRFIDDFADDIISAQRAKAELRAAERCSSWTEGAARWRAYLASVQAKEESLPGRWRGGRVRLARDFIAGTLGIRSDSIVCSDANGTPIELRAVLPTPISGRIGDEDGPWIKGIDYYEAGHMTRLLTTASLIVTAYLSGMRGQEAAELRRGCCVEIAHDDNQPARYAITGLEFKGALDGEGNRIRGGRQRKAPWVVIEPVARAIRVAERLSQSAIVFDRSLFGASDLPTAHRAETTGELSKRIRDFMDWVNAYCISSGRHEHVIPEDHAGLVNLTRFRRTLAWFIYRQPDGRVALGIQYGHVKSLTSDGYGSRASAGLRGIFPMEEALALIDGLNDAAERRDAGEKVSGPAASRYTDGVRQFNAQFRGKQLTPKQLNALRKNPRMRIYDNGQQPVACCYDAAKALRHPEKKRRNNTLASPDVTRCNPNCGNVARTDRHIASIRSEIANLHQEWQSPVTPEPLRQRIQQRIHSLEKLVDEHELSKVSE